MINRTALQLREPTLEQIGRYLSACNAYLSFFTAFTRSISLFVNKTIFTQKDSTIFLHSRRKMPVIGLGSWQLTKNTDEVIIEALRLGYRMIDTSGDYGTQPGIAEGLKKSDVSREDIYLVTKVEEDEDAYEAVRRNCAELEITHADLFLIHRPPTKGVGVALWEGLIRAAREGLTKDIGVSNYSAEQIQELITATGIVPVVNQIEWSPFGYSEEMFTFAKRNNIVIQAYSPLTRTKQLDDPTLNEIAGKYDKSPAQILIRWNLERGTVPIPKANQLQHLAENIDVFDFSLKPDDLNVLNNLNRHYSSLGTLPYVE